MISPKTKGTGTPARVVFCVPPKLYDSLGFSSSPNSGTSGRGNNISLTPDNTKALPRRKAPFAPKNDAALKLAPKPFPKVKALAPKAPKAPKDKAINAPPSKILPKLPPAP